MNERDWYDQMNSHPEIHDRQIGSGGGTCGTCRHTGRVGSNDYGPPGVRGYWCQHLHVPVSGSKTCRYWRDDH